MHKKNDMEINQELIDKIKKISENKWFVNKDYSLFASNNDVVEVNQLFNEENFNEIAMEMDGISFSKFNSFKIGKAFKNGRYINENILFSDGVTISFNLPSSIMIFHDLNFGFNEDEEFNNLLNPNYYISNDRLKELLLNKVEIDYKNKLNILNKNL